MTEQATPLISLVILCYNEAEVIDILKKQLKSLAARMEDKYRFEYISIDDGSRDGTWDKVLQGVTTYQEVLRLTGDESSVLPDLLLRI